MRKKSWWELKKSKEDKQNLEEWNSARRCSEAKCQLVQTSYIKRIELLLLSLTELSRSVWENLEKKNSVGGVQSHLKFSKI